MPRIKKVSYLQNLCLENIALNIEEWYKVHLEISGYRKVNQLIDAKSPFDSLRKFCWNYGSRFDCFKTVWSFLFSTSVILKRIIRTLVYKKLLNIQRLEMLITSNLRTLRFSWFDKQHLSVIGKDEIDEAIIIDLLHRTSIICPVTIFEC